MDFEWMEEADAISVLSSSIDVNRAQTQHKLASMHACM